MTTDDIAIQEHDNLMRKSAMDMKDKSFNYSIIKNSDRGFSCQNVHNNKQGRCVKHGKNSLRSSFSCMRCFHVCIVNVTSSTNFPLVNRFSARAWVGVRFFSFNKNFDIFRVNIPWIHFFLQQSFLQRMLSYVVGAAEVGKTAYLPRTVVLCQR